MGRVIGAAKEKFGGVKINFAPVADVTVGQVFGIQPLSPTEITAKIWAFIKKEGLKQVKKVLVKT